MAESQATTTDAQTTTITIHMSGKPKAGQETDTESESFRIARDLRSFGTDAFDDFDVDPQHAADVAFTQLGDAVEYEHNAESTDELLETIFRECQGANRSSTLPYDGTQVRSMQVGDVVVVNGMPHMVDSFGFTAVGMDFE